MPLTVSAEWYYTVVSRKRAYGQCTFGAQTGGWADINWAINKVTAHDIMDVTSPIETSTKFTSAWQNQLHQASPYKCVPYSSHSACFSRISIRMDAAPLDLLYRCASLWRNAKWALQSEQSSLKFAMRRWSGMSSQSLYILCTNLLCTTKCSKLCK